MIIELFEIATSGLWQFLVIIILGNIFIQLIKLFFDFIYDMCDIFTDFLVCWKHGYNIEEDENYREDENEIII